MHTAAVLRRLKAIEVLILLYSTSDYTRLKLMKLNNNSCYKKVLYIQLNILSLNF